MRDWTSARVANLLTANEEKLADALREAVAPVKISVGGWVGFFSAALRRRGSTACEKWKPPLLFDSESDVSFGKGGFFSLMMDFGDGGMVEFEGIGLLVLPVYLKWCQKRLLGLLKERLDRELASGVEYRGLVQHSKLASIPMMDLSNPLSTRGQIPRSTHRTGRIRAKLGIDFLEDIFDTLWRADVRRNTDRIATAIIDLLLQT